MTQDASFATTRDHDAALHMNVSAAKQPVRTRAVGHLSHACPLSSITLPLKAVGQERLPASLLTPHDGLHLHPALVAAAAHATCMLVAAKIGAVLPGDDAGLFARLPRGRRALGAADARWTEMALHRIQWMMQFIAPVTGGTRLHGIVRWVTNPGPRLLREGSDAAALALETHFLLAFSSPPIATLRRAPSLEYYRSEGVMVLRHFGEFTRCAPEGQ